MNLYSFIFEFQDFLGLIGDREAIIVPVSLSVSNISLICRLVKMISPCICYYDNLIQLAQAIGMLE
jgi:hypothetical protein